MGVNTAQLFTSMNTLLPKSHTPTTCGTGSRLLNFDKHTKYNDIPTLMGSKDESSPKFLFETYWLSRWGNINNILQHINLSILEDVVNSSY